MTIPLIALAVLSIFGGLIDLPFVNANLDFLDKWLAPVLRGVPDIEPGSFLGGFALASVALVLAVVGIVVGRALYLNGLNADGTDPAVERLGPVAGVLENAYYLDVGLARFVSGPITRFARFLSDGIDRRGIDGAVNGIGGLFQLGGRGLRRMQTGLVRNYALAILFGTVLLLLYFTTRASL
jgi:NADH-quinone oxidoreductase subunit L